MVWYGMVPPYHTSCGDHLASSYHTTTIVTIPTIPPSTRMMILLKRLFWLEKESQRIQALALSQMAAGRFQATNLSCTSRRATTTTVPHHDAHRHHDSTEDTKQHSFRVYLLRHGETDANKFGIIQGSSDFSRLTDEGKQQAAAVPLPSVAIDAVYVSPLTRAQETYHILRQQPDNMTKLPAHVETLDNLREIDFYDWEAEDKETLEAKFPESWQAWLEGDPYELRVYENKMKLHYPLQELWFRADRVWDEIWKPSKGNRSVLIVSHGSLGQALLGAAMGWDATHFRKHEFSNCGLLEIVWNNLEDDGGLPAGLETHRPLASKWRWRWPDSSPWRTFQPGPEDTKRRLRHQRSRPWRSNRDVVGW